MSCNVDKINELLEKTITNLCRLEEISKEIEEKAEKILNTSLPKESAFKID